MKALPNGLQGQALPTVVGSGPIAQRAVEDRPSEAGAAPVVDEALLPYVIEELKQLRQEHLDERRLLISAEHEAIHGFSRLLLTLSTAALGFSLTVVGLRGSAGPVEMPGILFASWASFGLAMITVLCSYYSSHKAFRRAWKARDRKYEAEAASKVAELTQGTPPAVVVAHVTGPPPAPPPMPKTMDRLNITSLIAFAVGVVALILFSIINLPH